MGYLFENMEKMDIQLERRSRKEEALAQGMEEIRKEKESLEQKAESLEREKENLIQEMGESTGNLWFALVKALECIELENPS